MRTHLARWLLVALAMGAGLATALGPARTPPASAAPTLTIAAGFYHTCALLGDGTAKCWGSNDYGQLGDNSTTERHTPVTVFGLSNAVAIAAGGLHTCALLPDGTAGCWGRNNFGQLGDGTSGTDRHTPVGPDSDSDDSPDIVDNCRFVTNADQLNTDSACIPNGVDISGDCRANPDKDTLGDACDPDRDNDGLTDAEEAVGCGSGPTDPLKMDTDGDRAIDGYECKVGTNPNDSKDRPTCTGSTDTDGDGITDCVEEMGYGTSPLMTDTDGDSSGNDGCQDDKQIADVNGDGQANVLDVFAVAKIALVAGSYDPVSKAVADINKDGANNILDIMPAAKNSSLVESHTRC